jgi:hypothetical protein
VCGWLSTRPESAPRVVWARKQVSTFICPKSFITPRSLAWLEEYFVWRNLGRQMDRNMNARTLEAFMILEHQVSLEMNSGAK